MDKALIAGIEKTKETERLVDAEVDAENAKANDAAASLEKLGTAKLATSRKIKTTAKDLATADRLHMEGQAKVEAGSKLVSQALKIMEEKKPVMKAAKAKEAVLLGKMAVKAAAKAAAELMVAKATTVKNRIQLEIKPMIVQKTNVRKAMSMEQAAQSTAELKKSEAAKTKDDAERAAEDADGEAKDAALNEKKSEQKAVAAATEASNDAEAATAAKKTAAEAEGLKGSAAEVAAAEKTAAAGLKVEEEKKSTAIKAKKKSLEADEMVAMVDDKNKAKVQAKENEASNERASDKRVGEEKAAVKEDNAADEAEKAEVKKGNDEVKGAKKLNNADVTAQLAASAAKSKAKE